MKRNLLLVMAAIAAASATAYAEPDNVVVTTESVTEFIAPADECPDIYYTSAKDNWFIQAGVGVDLPVVERHGVNNGSANDHFTMTYNLGAGKWVSPYVGLRLTTYFAHIHWDNFGYSKAKMINANFDVMWDMFNSFGGVKDRAVSIVPFVGLGGTFMWNFDAPGRNVYQGENPEVLKRNSWTLPVSAGIQLKVRLCKYADFFVEGRASMYGDNFNNTAYGAPVDVNVSAIGGFIFNIGGSSFKSYNPCNDLAYISSLNGQINALRADLATTTAALAVAESQLPCPEATVVEQQAPAAPMLTTVRFTINSAKVSPEEMVNVYNVAEYLKANPQVNVTIAGYADKDTGTAAYNKELSARRAQAVYDILTNTYGIAKDRLTTQAEGSSVQPYDTNNWNRIVIFVPAN